MLSFKDFKNWFDGFQEAIGDTPTKEQWARIKEKYVPIYTQPRVDPFWMIPPTIEPSYPHNPAPFKPPEIIC